MRLESLHQFIDLHGQMIEPYVLLIHLLQHENLKTFCLIKAPSQVIGDNNLIMGSCHIAHDCKVGHNNILANNTLLAGHVTVEVSCSYAFRFHMDNPSMVVEAIHLQDYVHTAGATVVHQFCHLGSFSFVGGGSVVNILTKLAPTCIVVILLMLMLRKLYLLITRAITIHISWLW